MFEEPSRWVEAVNNRRQYLEEQFTQGSSVIAFSFDNGILLLTLNRGTHKLYEIYDRIALGGMGHPADLEKLRFSLLDMAHIEGFQRSPSDVTASRLVKYGLAPIIKQAFEEIFKAPLITKLLLAELGQHGTPNHFFTIEYDGGFEEYSGSACIGTTAMVQDAMTAYRKSFNFQGDEPLNTVLEAALKTWSLGLWHHIHDETEQESHNPDAGIGHSSETGYPDESQLVECLREALSDKTLECVILNRTLPGPSTYQVLSPDTITTLLPPAFQGIV